MVFICKITYYNFVKEKTDTDFVGLTASSFTKAVEKIEKVYGEDLESLEISFEDEGELLRIPRRLVPDMRDAQSDLFEDTPEEKPTLSLVTLGE